MLKILLSGLVVLLGLMTLLGIFVGLYYLFVSSGLFWKITSVMLFAVLMSLMFGLIGKEEEDVEDCKHCRNGRK